MHAEPIISESLKALWTLVEGGLTTQEAYSERHESLINRYREEWTSALLLPGSPNLEESAIRELGEYFPDRPPEDIRRRCMEALREFKEEWERKVTAGNGSSIEQFYDQNQSYIYELMWWHTLSCDISPLSYIVAKHLAERYHCSTYLDFGTGVSSGGLLFARHGVDVSVADISSPLLRFSSWRFERRSLPVKVIDLKRDQLPIARFDFITAMDVFEHLTDPVGAVESLGKALKPHGIIFGRFHTDDDDDRAQHIVRDFGPTFRKLESLGFEQVWEDDWLWGHKAFRRTTKLSPRRGVAAGLE
jgi:2-polyprenyl-3-methyl-5-hydroxy-6-metoxy-1,4-benzoquinol methylase